MAKHILEIEYDYDFVLIGISSHEKDYRFCWRLNKLLEINLIKQNSLEIKNKKQKTPSFFSFYLFENKSLYTDYAVLANISENKQSTTESINLFGELIDTESDTDFLLPELKQFNYFYIIKGEVDDNDVEETTNKIKTMENVQTALRIDVNSLRSKQNLIF